MLMIPEKLPCSAVSPANVALESAGRTAASYERELAGWSNEIRLRETLAREEALLAQRDELIRQQELLSRSPIIGCSITCK